MQDQIEWLKWMWGAIFVPFIIHLYKKIDNAVDRKEYNDTIKSLRDEIREGNRALTERFDSLMQMMVEKNK